MYSESNGAEDGEKDNVNAFQGVGKALVGCSVGVGVLVRAVEAKGAAIFHECWGFEKFFDALVQWVRSWVDCWELGVDSSSEMLGDVELISQGNAMSSCDGKYFVLAVAIESSPLDGALARVFAPEVEGPLNTFVSYSKLAT